MRSLTAQLTRCESSAEAVASVLTSTEMAFSPRLPGLTKLMGKFTKDGEWRKALAIFDTLPSIGLHPDTTITNAAITACDKGGNWVKAKALFDGMVHWGLHRDTITYSSVISALSKSRHWATAARLFLHMCDCGIQADAVTCCSLINAMDRAGLWQVAELVLLALCARMPAFHDMRAQPPLDLAAVLDAAERSLVQTLCLRLSGGSDDASWPESPSDASPLSRLDSGMGARSEPAESSGHSRFQGTRGKSANVDSLSDYLAHSSFFDSQATHIPAGLSRGGSASNMQPFPGQLTLPVGSRLPCCREGPNRVCCNALLASYSRASPPQWQRALALIDCMSKHPGALSPDTVSFNTVLRALATAGRAVEAQALYKRMLGTGVKETAASVAALMAAATANGQAEWALTMWQGLQRGSLRPTAACATARMDALLHLGRRQEAHEFFRMLAQGSMQPLAPAGDAAALLMHDLLRHGDPAAAVGFFQTLPRMPVRPPPSASLVSVAVDAFVACGQWTDAAATLASGSRNSAAAPAAAVSLMCNMARTATALPRDAQELDVLVKTAHEVLELAAPVAAADGALEDVLEAALVLANITRSPPLVALAASVGQTNGLHLPDSFLRLALSTCCHCNGLGELVSTLAEPSVTTDLPAAESAVLLLSAACLLYSSQPQARSFGGHPSFPVQPSSPAVCAPWTPPTVEAAVKLLCDVDHTIDAAALFWAALVVMPPRHDGAGGRLAGEAGAADSGGADVEVEPLAKAVQQLIVNWAQPEELPRVSLVADLCRAVFASAKAGPQDGWSASCNVLLQSLLRDMRSPVQQEAVLQVLDAMSARELAPDAPSTVALMGASITLPEPAVHTLLHTAPQATDASVIMQLLDSAAEAPDLPRAVRIARAAHRAGALTCYSTHPSDAPAAVPLRTLHVALLPPRLVPCVLLAWLTELAEQPPPSGMRGSATEEAPFVVVTGTAPATEGTRRGSSGSGGSAVVPSLEMWSARDPVAISEASAGSPHVTPDPQAADRAIQVLAVLEAGGAPSPQPAAAAVSDVDDTPVHCSPLTFAISEATASATIREMTRTEPGASAVASPVRTAPALRAMTPVKQSGAAAAPTAGIPVTVAADMHLVTAPAADMRRWLSTQLAAGHFREYGSLSRSGGSGSGDAGRRS